MYRKDIQHVLNSFDNRTLAYAFKNYNFYIKDELFRNVSKRRSIKIFHDTTLFGNKDAHNVLKTKEVIIMSKKKTIMESKILNGVVYKDSIFNEIKNEISNLKVKHKKVPGIAFIAVVGHEPLMKYTIALHEQAANELGFNVILETRPDNVTEEELFVLVEKLNLDNNIHLKII